MASPFAERSEYLRYAISHLENRISMMDNRSSILIAAHAVLFAVYAEFVKSGFLYEGADPTLKNWGVLFICLAFPILVAAVFMLLKSIRPSRFPLGFKIEPERLEGVHFEFLWPGARWEQKVNQSEYEEAFANLDESQIMEGLKNTNFVLLCHVKKKLTYYEIAAYLPKVLVIYYLLSTILLYVIFQAG